MKNIMEWAKLNFEQCMGGGEDRDYWRGIMTILLKQPLNDDEKEISLVSVRD